MYNNVEDIFVFLALKVFNFSNFLHISVTRNPLVIIKKNQQLKIPILSIISKKLFKKSVLTCFYKQSDIYTGLTTTMSET